MARLSNNASEQITTQANSRMNMPVQLDIRALVHDERGGMTVGTGIVLGMCAVAACGVIGVATSNVAPVAVGSVAPVVKQAGFEKMTVDARICFVEVEGSATVEAPVKLIPEGWGPFKDLGTISKTSIYNAQDKQGKTEPIGFIHSCPKLKSIRTYVDPNAERATGQTQSDTPVVKVEIDADDLETIIEPARIISLWEYVDSNKSFNAADREALDAYNKFIADLFRGNKELTIDDVSPSDMLMNLMHTTAREHAYETLETDCMNALRENKNYVDAARQIFAYFAAKSFNENHPDEPPISVYDVLVTIKAQTLPADKNALAHIAEVEEQKKTIEALFAKEGITLDIKPFTIGEFTNCKVNVGPVTEEQIRDAVGGWAKNQIPTKLPVTPTPEPTATASETPTPTESVR
jgi:hypothetical protein